MILAALFIAVSIGLIAFMTIRLLGPGGLIEKDKHFKGRLSPSGQAVFTAQASPDLVKRNNLSNIKVFKRMLNRRQFAEKLMVLLKTAQLKVSVSTYFLVCFAIGVSSFLVAHFVLHFNILQAGPVSIGLCFLPFLYLKFMRTRYLDKFQEQLPNALSIISGSIKVGHGLEAAIGTIAKTAPYPLSSEFATVQAEMKLGLGLGDALTNLYQRIKSEELKILVTGIMLNQQLGGNLSELLNSLEKTIRERFQLMREIKALSSQGIMSATVLFVVPFLIFGLFIKNDPGLMWEFLRSPAGKMGITVSAILQIIAFFWIRSIIRLKD